MNLLYMYIFLTVERANFTYLSQFVVFVYTWFIPQIVPQMYDQPQPKKS